jgi:hypothetical protein
VSCFGHALTLVPTEYEAVWAPVMQRLKVKSFAQVIKYQSSSPQSDTILTELPQLTFLLAGILSILTYLYRAETGTIDI